MACRESSRAGRGLVGRRGAGGFAWSSNVPSSTAGPRHPPACSGTGRESWGGCSWSYTPQKPLCLLSRHTVEAGTRLWRAQVVCAPSPAAFTVCGPLGPLFPDVSICVRFSRGASGPVGECSGTGGPWAHQAPRHPACILTLQLGRAVGDGSRSGEELDGERRLHAPDEGDGDPWPLHRNHPGHRRDSAPVLKEPGARRERMGGLRQPCSTPTQPCRDGHRVPQPEPKQCCQ